MKFCADLQNIEGLRFAGIDIVNLANNHAGNYGSEGVKTTIPIGSSQRKLIKTN
jgi:hypothetical protein